MGSRDRLAMLTTICLVFVTGCLGYFVGADGAKRHPTTPEPIASPKTEAPRPSPTAAAQDAPGDCSEQDEQITQLRMALAFAKGQLVATVGEVPDWPADSIGLTPGDVEANLNLLLLEEPRLAIEELDCSEYPCMAVLNGGDIAEDEREEVKALIRNILGIPQSTSSTMELGGDWIYTVAVADPAARKLGSDIHIRLGHRLDALNEVTLSNFVQDMRANPPPPELGPGN